MVLYVKNKFVSIDGGSFVVDEQGNKLYQIKGKVISPTRKKYIYDINGNLLYIVRNKFWHFFTKKAFIYNADNTKYCKVKERFLGVAPKIANCDDELICEFAGLGKGVSVYKNGTLIAIFRSATDLDEWSKTNEIPGITYSTDKRNRKVKGRFTTHLRSANIHRAIRNNTIYRGLRFKKCSPLPPEMGVVKWENCWNGEIPNQQPS